MAQDLDLKIRLSADGKAALGGLRDVDSGMQQLEATAKKVGAAVAAYLSFDFLASATRALFDVTAQLQAFQGRFAALAGSAQAGAAQMAYVQETAKRLSMDLNVARESYAQLLTLQNAGLATQEQARALMEGYGKAAIMTGASNEQLKQSMAGLAQAMAMGTVSTENAMQALEPIPGLQKKVADALQMSIAEMKDAWAKGTISSQQFGDAVAKALNEMGKGAETMANTLGPTLQRVKNEWQLLQERIGQTSGFAGAAAQALGLLADHLTAVAAIVGGALAMAIAAGTVALAKWTVQMVASTAAALAKVIADNAAAQAALRAAQANVAMGVGLGALAEAQTRAAVAAAALRTVFAGLFGVGGLILIGVSVFASLLAATEKQDAATDALTQSTEEYTAALKKMTDAQREVARIDLDRSLTQWQQKLADVKRQMEDLPSLQSWTTAMDPLGEGTNTSEMALRLQAEYDGIQKTIQGLEEKRQALDAVRGAQAANSDTQTQAIDVLNKEATAQQKGLKTLQAMNESRQKVFTSLVDEAKAYTSNQNAIENESTARELAIELAHRQANASQDYAAGLLEELSANQRYLALLQQQATLLSGPAKAAKDEEISQVQRLIAETEAAVKAADAKAQADQAAIALAGEAIDSKQRERDAQAELTKAYLTGNPALIEEAKLRADIAGKPLHQQFAAEQAARAQLNQEVAKATAGLSQEAVGLQQEITAVWQGEAAVRAWTIAKAQETAARTTNDPRLRESIALQAQETETLKVLLDLQREVMSAYERGLTPAQKYAKALADIDDMEARLQTKGNFTA